MSDSALLGFFAQALELETESAERYQELADTMAAHHNAPVAAFFARMAGEARQHLAEVEDLVAGRSLPTIPAWEFQWPGAEPPETLSYEALHYRMGLREAMQLALRNERAAEAFYAQCAREAQDTDLQRLANLFAAEESSHAEQLALLIDQAPPEPELGREEDDPPHMPE